MARSGMSKALAVASLFLLGSWTFCGVQQRQVAPETARNGWRLDKMEVGPGGIGQLVVSEGYWVGEKDLFEILSKQGVRYRMRATSKEQSEINAGTRTGPAIWKLGPFKIRGFEAFGGTGGDEDAVLTEGFSGYGGTAGWGQLPFFPPENTKLNNGLPIKKQGYGR
mmetsp:Transcript_102370/g.181782  ORF Transcript_102370/g.181782 Transcript_102370/m.181782 type:complete len:166 (-) Transcript_102370:115-612(-)